VKITLKTMVSNASEVPFLWMMFHEAASLVDRIVVTEFNQTHSGLNREFLFHEYVDDFLSVFPNLIYLQGKDIPGVIRNADSSEGHHHNETLMRGWFASQLKFRNWEYVVSTDADEVLYESTYKWVHDNLSWRDKGVRFRLHQFFYRPNFLWEGKEFIAPVALRFGHYGQKYPENWRYQGKKLPGYWGAHFSWCIPAEEMARKLKNYSHAHEQKHLSNVDLMRQARQQRLYPFEPEEDLRLSAIPYSSPLLPDGFRKYRHLLSAEVLGQEGVDW